MNRFLALLLACIMTPCWAYAEKQPGIALEEAAQARNLTTFVTLMKIAGLDDTLKAGRQVTVLAPDDAAFAKLPAGALEELMKPQSRRKLANILAYHLIPGRLPAADMEAAVKANGGKLILKTVQGETLTILHGNDGKWWVTDNSEDMAEMTPASLVQKAGIIHVLDTLLLPK